MPLWCSVHFLLTLMMLMLNSDIMGRAKRTVSGRYVHHVLNRANGYSFHYHAFWRIS